MLETIFGGAGIMGLGIVVARSLYGRVNRVEDQTNNHLRSLDKKVDELNREVGEVKVVVERIDKKLP